VLLSLALIGCASRPQINEGPHKGWSESLATEDVKRQEAEESQYQNALQRFD
jgi:hypothetical protein